MKTEPISCGYTCECKSEEECQVLKHKMEPLKVKTVDEIVRSMSVDDANLRHIAKTGRINGSLSMSIKDALRDYTSHLQSHITKLEAENKELREALSNIEKSCDGSNPSHFTIWHLAEQALKLKP